MRIISFAWTTDAFLQGKKTATRRDWTDKTAERWKVGDIAQAYDRSPRFGGKRIGFIKVTAIFKQWLHEVTDQDEIEEGGLWGSGEAYRIAMGTNRMLWVIKFEKTEGI